MADAPENEVHPVARTLTPEMLGAAGEADFARLCAMAGLVCNKSNQDLTGWDFLVEFPMPAAGPAAPLDQRVATTCRVQLKTTSRPGRVAMRLSAAERLAKDPQPTLLIVFRMKGDGEPICGYCIAIIGAELARVLRSLRIAHQAKRFDVNHASISFDFAKLGQRFDLTPAGLRTALQEACGPDPVTYHAEKQRQLAELGYEDDRYQAEARFQIESADQLSRILLGLEPIVPERLAVYETRFGVPLPYHGDLFSEAEEFLITPPHIGECTVTVRDAPLSPPATFRASMFVGPPIEEVGGAKLLIRHPDFNLTFGEHGAHFETVGIFADGARTVTSWVPLLRALAYLASGHGNFGLTFDDKRFGSLNLAAATQITGPYIEQLPQLADFVTNWEKLLELAGVAPGSAWPIDAIWEASEVSLALDLFFGAPPTAWFAFDSDAFGNPEGPVDALYFNSCAIGEDAISYSVKLTLAPSENGEHSSIAFTPLDVRPIVDDLDAYATSQMEAHGLTIQIHPDAVTRIAAADSEA